MQTKSKPRVITTHVLHCCKCMRRRVFTRRVSKGWEHFTCQVCGAVQSYKLKEDGYENQSA